MCKNHVKKNEKSFKCDAIFNKLGKDGFDWPLTKSKHFKIIIFPFLENKGSFLCVKKEAFAVAHTLSTYNEPNRRPEVVRAHSTSQRLDELDRERTETEVGEVAAVSTNRLVRGQPLWKAGHLRGRQPGRVRRRPRWWDQRFVVRQSSFPRVNPPIKMWRVILPSSSSGNKLWFDPWIGGDRRSVVTLVPGHQVPTNVFDPKSWKRLLFDWLWKWKSFHPLDQDIVSGLRTQDG